MENRKIVILKYHLHSDISHLLSKFDSNVIVFSFEKLDCENNIIVPAEFDSLPKFKNYAIRYFKDMKYDGFIHFIEDVVEILKDPAEFMTDVEAMMTALDINSYFGTITDRCNLVYNKYCPRLTLNMNEPRFEKFNLKKLSFCSHSNVHWVVINLGLADDNELYFNEDFEIPMYWIIEFLARRRNTHTDTMYFMNQYVTCGSEQGVYKLSQQQIEPNKKLTIAEIREQNIAEDKHFAELKVDYHPDNNLDLLMERLYNKLMSKTV